MKFILMMHGTRGYAIAALASVAPGAGGAAMNMPIEVRQAMSAPPVDG